MRFRDQLFFTASNGSHVVGWSTQQALQGLLPPEVAVPLVRSSVEDSNFDGRADALKLNVDGGAASGRRIVMRCGFSVEALSQFGAVEL